MTQTVTMRHRAEEPFNIGLPAIGSSSGARAPTFVKELGERQL